MQKITAAFALSLVLLSQTAIADEFGHHGPGWRGGPGPGRFDHDWHGGPGGWHGDIHHFRDYDFDRWRGGRWVHGFHDGRDGWWWSIGTSWYYYPAPVYPYPDPYSPPTVVATPGVTAYWYCSSPAGYYPYVSACAGPWQQQLAAAAPVAAPPLVAPPPVVEAPQTVIGTTMLGPQQRDDRQLNSYGARFAAIGSGKGSAHQLKGLRDEVEAFRQSLLQRDYNAMELLRDTERLEQQIDARRASLKKPKVVVVPVPVPAPPPATLPPPQ